MKKYIEELEVAGETVSYPPAKTNPHQNQSLVWTGDKWRHEGQFAARAISRQVARGWLQCNGYLSDMSAEEKQAIHDREKTLFTKALEKATKHYTYGVITRQEVINILTEELKGERYYG